jgi:hypothetical protein
MDAVGLKFVLTGNAASGAQDARSDAGAAAVDGEHRAIDVGGLLGAAGVRVGPGATALTRTPWGPYSAAHALVVMFTIAPPPLLAIPSSRPVIRTSAPAAAYARAVASPIPDAPPVTNAFLSCTVMT